MIRITKSVVDYPILVVEFNDGAKRRYDLSAWITSHPPSRAAWGDPVVATNFEVRNRGTVLAWLAGEVDTDADNLRYYEDDLDIHEWIGIPDTVLPKERVQMARKRMGRPTEITINLERELTPGQYAEQKGITVQAVSNQIRRGVLKGVRYIPELGLTLIPTDQEAA